MTIMFTCPSCAQGLRVPMPSAMSSKPMKGWVTTRCPECKRITKLTWEMVMQMEEEDK